MKYIIGIMLILLLSDCGNKEGDSKKDGIVKGYREDGTLYTEVSYKNEKLNGVSKTYHPNGKLYLEETFVNNTKHGKFLQYYATGILYSETPYDSGKIDGIVKRYHKDGKLKAEIPYKKGCECLGLKEYILNGDPRPHYPEIEIRTEDSRLTLVSYYIHVSLSERVKKVEFFKGNLKDGCMQDGLVPLISYSEETGRITYTLNPTESLNERINIVARIETIAGNILIKEKSYSVDIDPVL